MSVSDPSTSYISLTVYPIVGIDCSVATKSRAVRARVPAHSKRFCLARSAEWLVRAAVTFRWASPLYAPPGTQPIGLAPRRRSARGVSGAAELELDFRRCRDPPLLGRSEKMPGRPRPLSRTSPRRSKVRL